ncbi:MAG: 1D-myo-inosityl-2-acetamido-2-deoxy-alpha-D-glucopyranoside deacetylase [Pseudonocardiales bacterium]|nr:1D-myo-inosityl-2-acetamido-2-deoxy-alpha-D-glucopyranoside deacetylase [Pseudonocardiales bacterium]
MARYVAEGVQVSLVTCTLGEFGEILVPELIELEADRGDQLGGYRMSELAGALHALGVTDHHFLGGAGRFHDSGMMGTASNGHPRAFWRAAAEGGVFDDAVRCLVAIIREVRPQVVVTYDPNGGYGHPDHIMAHRVTAAAVIAAADAGVVPGPPWTVAKSYWTATSLAAVQTGLTELRDAGSPFADHEAASFPGATDEGITTIIDASAFLERKAEAMRAHATQITVAEPFYALSNNLGMKIDGVEHFRLVQGEPGGNLDEAGRETDLFGGVFT